VYLKKRILPFALQRKTSLSNAIYGNSSEFSDDVITIRHTNGAHAGPAAFLGYLIKIN